MFYIYLYDEIHNYLCIIHVSGIVSTSLWTKSYIAGFSCSLSSCSHTGAVMSLPESTKLDFLPQNIRIIIYICQPAITRCGVHKYEIPVKTQTPSSGCDLSGRFCWASWVKLPFLTSEANRFFFSLVGYLSKPSCFS